ncbi:hypothetical protein [Streptomyces sp. NPDC086182]|jgi:hypothetical protein|uniref:hypothetical protein n=1 Tax=Streptomyces sp. NPDC086182 TaxID=3155058 RepID=UPI0034382266
MLAEVPHPDTDPAAVAVRDLEETSIADDVQTLSWMGLLEVRGERLAITPHGRAAHFEAECAALSARLVEVHVFADHLQRRTPSIGTELHALRQLADGSWSVTEAVAYVERRGH